MIPVAFDYQRAESLEEALAALSAGDCKILAGGHSLLPAMKLRLNQPSKLVDISRIGALKGIKEEGNTILIGAGTTHGEIAGNALIREKLPFFATAASLIGDIQVRNYGTIGGSLAHADPSADWPALVLAADAVVVVMGSKGSRDIPATEFFTGFFSTALAENELITAIRIPIPPAGTKMTYQKFSQPASRFAIVGCAAMRAPDGQARIAFTGLSECAFRATGAENEISGKPLSGQSIQSAMEKAFGDRDILGDHFASSDYRLHLAKCYLEKALKEIG